jgi:hypothetical protein
MSKVEGFRQFDSMNELVAWIRLGGSLYYHAPLDLMPKRVRVEIRRETPEHGAQIRIRPLVGKDFDPFIADEGHLARFLIEDQAPSSDVISPEPDTLKEVESNHDFYGIPYSSDP